MPLSGARKPRIVVIQYRAPAGTGWTRLSLLCNHQRKGGVMATTKSITLFHSPQTRSTGALALLEELHAPYTLHPLNMKAGQHRQSDYLAVNPMGKVPAVLHG